MSKKANQLTNQIIDYIYKNGGYSWKQNSGGVYDKNIGIFRTGAKKGISDILGIYKGKFIACEVKIGKDHLSPEQILQKKISVIFQKNILPILKYLI